MFNFLCKIFGHKYRIEYIDENKAIYEYICKRCGKNRDLYNKGEMKNPGVNYYKKEDGKK